MPSIITVNKDDLIRIIIRMFNLFSSHHDWLNFFLISWSEKGHGFGITLSVCTLYFYSDRNTIKCISILLQVDVFHSSEESEDVQMLEGATTLQFLRDAYYGGQVGMAWVECV